MQYPQLQNWPTNIQMRKLGEFDKYLFIYNDKPNQSKVQNMACQAKWEQCGGTVDWLLFRGKVAIFNK
jgi:hypothetical protein